MKTALVFAIIGVVLVGIAAGCISQTQETSTTSTTQGQRGPPEGKGPIAISVGANGSTSIDVQTLKDYIDSVPMSPLTDEEKQGILWMREEEKLARDVYLTLYEKWDLPIFNNIAKSEQTHMDTVKLLIDKYGLEDPVIDEVGKFSNPELQELYNQLVEKGSKSVEDALTVGAMIEELDIVDLQKWISKTDKQDIITVYENLMKGSRNHLRSFVSNLKNYGITYEPQYLSKEEYEEIINSPIETGDSG
ncbi:hypothetical protein PAP_08585 [Palaeococcus pacificus DY20341]|uniref:DUF2202 domain-containing protein n=2 Tax=Palaeococcus TaxID=83867 RepID=A0A075LZX3_9EURY|nr:hypothetical protein PAP_08585 [Palaeococcus pacificus DY20341]